MQQMNKHTCDNIFDQESVHCIFQRDSPETKTTNTMLVILSNSFTYLILTLYIKF